jgi:hypothetical protein
MQAFFIVLVVFTFLSIGAFLDNKSKKHKADLKAHLRMEEMARGYEPGTYSDYHAHKHTKSSKTTTDFKQQKARIEKEELEQGIKDLKERVSNLQTILDAKNKESRDGK